MSGTPGGLSILSLWAFAGEISWHTELTSLKGDDVAVGVKCQDGTSRESNNQMGEEARSECTIQCEVNTVFIFISSRSLLYASVCFCLSSTGKHKGEAAVVGDKVTAAGKEWVRAGYTFLFLYEVLPRMRPSGACEQWVNRERERETRLRLHNFSLAKTLWSLNFFPATRFSPQRLF